MSVSEGFLGFVLEQLGRIAPVTDRKMFGGVGIYGRGLFFALIDDDVLYFKVDDGNRADFEARGMQPFRPFGEEGTAMRYYEVPGDVMEDADLLAPWVEKALAAAQTAQGRRGALVRGSVPRRRAPRPPS
jgi:DNA transformation protein